MKHGSLFSGIGGFDLAAQWMGWKNVFHCEKDEYCRQILEKRFPGTRIIKDVRDIYRFTDEYEDVYGDREVMMCDRHGVDFGDCECIGCSEWDDEIGQIDILTGGFPCVDITNAKNAKEKPKGLEGEASGLWNEYKRILGHLRPRYAIVENSSNLNVRGLYRIIGDITELRYDCFWFTLPASKVGAPHRRRRTFIVANSNEQRLERNECIKLANEVKRRFDANLGRSTWWDAEPPVDRVVDGLPGRVDKKRERLTALGNAVVPQVALQIFKAIQQTKNHK